MSAWRGGGEGDRESSDRINGSQDLGEEGN